VRALDPLGDEADALLDAAAAMVDATDAAGSPAADDDEDGDAAGGA
jgi:hypothetical protein